MHSYNNHKYDKWKAKNQIVLLSGILILLATATIVAASYNVQTAKAVSTATDNFGKVASFQAHGGIGPEANSPRLDFGLELEHQDHSIPLHSLLDPLLQGRHLKSE